MHTRSPPIAGHLKQGMEQGFKGTLGERDVDAPATSPLPLAKSLRSLPPQTDLSRRRVSHQDPEVLTPSEAIDSIKLELPNLLEHLARFREVVIRSAMSGIVTFLSDQTRSSAIDAYLSPQHLPIEAMEKLLNDSVIAVGMRELAADRGILHVLRESKKSPVAERTRSPHVPDGLASSAPVEHTRDARPAPDEATFFDDKIMMDDGLSQFSIDHFDEMPSEPEEIDGWSKLVPGDHSSLMTSADKDNVKGEGDDYGSDMENYLPVDQGKKRARSKSTKSRDDVGVEDLSRAISAKTVSKRKAHPHDATDSDLPDPSEERSKRVKKCRKSARPTSSPPLRVVGNFGTGRQTVRLQRVESTTQTHGFRIGREMYNFDLYKDPLGRAARNNNGEAPVAALVPGTRRNKRQKLSETPAARSLAARKAINGSITEIKNYLSFATAWHLSYSHLVPDVALRDFVRGMAQEWTSSVTAIQAAELKSPGQLQNSISKHSSGTVRLDLRYATTNLAVSEADEGSQHSDSDDDPLDVLSD